MDDMETKRELRPKMSFKGKLIWKSWNCFREVRIANNIIRAVTEKQTPIKDAMAKRSKADCPSSLGFALLVPPGTKVEVAKETPTTRIATTEQELEVSFIHSELSYSRFSWFSLKTSPSVLLALFVLNVKCFGTRSLTYCINASMHEHAN